jgi:hypothetical protein
MTPSRCFLAALAGVLVAGLPVNGAENKIPDTVQTILAKADKFELYSLDPDRGKEKPKDKFHGWKVLGKAALKTAETRKKLIEALRKGVKANDGTVADCFNPRHGIRATHQGKTVDLVICFECYSMIIYEGKKTATVLTTGAPQPVFDKVLKEAKVPLPPKAKGR